jgi:hypothetical protein
MQFREHAAVVILTADFGTAMDARMHKGMKEEQEQALIANCDAAIKTAQELSDRMCAKWGHDRTIDGVCPRCGARWLGPSDRGE